MKLKLGQIADWIHAEGDFSTELEALGYSIDSRTLAAGDLFFAVRGERMDGHDYVEAALKAGAIAAVVSRSWEAPDEPERVDPCKLLWVPENGPPPNAEDNVLVAMQRLAHQVRKAWANASSASPAQQAKPRPKKPSPKSSPPASTFSNPPAISTTTSASRCNCCAWNPNIKLLSSKWA